MIRLEQIYRADHRGSGPERPPVTAYQPEPDPPGGIVSGAISLDSSIGFCMIRHNYPSAINLAPNALCLER